MDVQLRGIPLYCATQLVLTVYVLWEAPWSDDTYKTLFEVRCDLTFPRPM